MKLLTDQTVKHVVQGDSGESESQPWEAPDAETEETVIRPDQDDILDPPRPDCVQMFVRLEGTSCIRLDSLGGGKIQLAFSDAQAGEAFELGKYRGKNLLATFIISSKEMPKKGRQ